MVRPVATLVVLVLAGCATAPTRHGTLSGLSRVSGAVTLCSHGVPEPVCTRHHPEKVEEFKRVGDWCPEHDIPESQCLLCHPDLTFEPLPTLPEGADLQWLSQAGEDVPELASLVVKGKVTVFDFYADWCAPCQKVDRHVYGLLQHRQDLAVRKLNVVTWDSALARHHLSGVAGLPHLRVYGRDGKLVGPINGLDLAALDRALAEGAAR
jgi:thiol-disulfide isomerase/thioredoxin